MSYVMPYFFCLIPLLFVLLIHLILIRKQWFIRRWKKSLNLYEHEQIFQKIYTNSQGFRLSKNARRGHDAIEYAYGEIEFLSFIALLSLTRPNRKTVFYDLGAGTGKAVLACCMVYPVRRAVGIELFPELYLDSCKHAKQLIAMKHYADKTDKIKFILDDFIHVNLNDATLIFINSTTLIGPIWEKLCSKLDKLTHLKSIITISKSLRCSNYTIVRTTQVKMSWGVASAFIHTRKGIEKIE